MRITICELPHEPAALAAAWEGLCAHVARHRPALVLLPELAFVPPLWEREEPDQRAWEEAVALADAWMARLPELRAGHVVGTRPVVIGGRPFNQGFAWSAGRGVVPLRRKFWLPDERGWRESRWFDAGDAEFPVYRAGDVAFGLNICTELWALETYAAYAARDVRLVLSPRATSADTAAKWLAVGRVAAVRSGAFSVSSNRRDESGACGGVGWVIGPDGRLLGSTTAAEPFATIAVDLAASAAARSGYPCSVFAPRVPYGRAGGSIAVRNIAG
jgi:N-carbamoylputrescine amidase